MKEKFLTEKEVQEMREDLYDEIRSEKKNDEVSLKKILNEEDRKKLKQDFKEIQDSFFESEEVKNFFES